jgi:hypothetical protein
VIPTACLNHRYAVRTIDEARSIVALERVTLSPAAHAELAAMITSGKPGDCPAASHALYLTAAALRECVS